MLPIKVVLPNPPEQLTAGLTRHRIGQLTYVTCTVKIGEPYVTYTGGTDTECIDALERMLLTAVADLRVLRGSL